MRRRDLINRFNHSVAMIDHLRASSVENLIMGATDALEKIETADGTQPMGASDFWVYEDGSPRWYRPYEVVNGILQIPVRGMLLHNLAYQLGDWATGYDYIRAAFDRGMDDGNVEGIALLCDTPGGEVAGNFDLVDFMYARMQEPDRKPVRAFAHESAYSAGYSIASVADQIVVSRTGGVGSIGVVTAHFDYSEAIAKNGIKVTWIFAGDHKVDGNRFEPLPDAVKKRIQGQIDKLMTVFVATVARNRPGLSEQAVRDTQALTYIAEDGVQIGLADQVGTLEDGLATFATDIFVGAEDGEEQMAQPQDTGSKPGAGSNEAAVNAARAEGVKEGAQAERTRISAILGSDEGKKRPKAALSAALRTDMSVEQATAFLGEIGEETPATAVVQEPANPEASADKDKKNLAASFENAMKEGNPDLGSQAGAKEPTRGEKALVLAGFVKDRKAA